MIHEATRMSESIGNHRSAFRGGQYLQRMAYDIVAFVITPGIVFNEITDALHPVFLAIRARGCAAVH